MAAAVAPAFSMNNQHGVLPPSALVQHSSPRHGRSRGMSFKGKNGRGRGYSLVEDRDVSIAKALMFVLKRTITEEQVDEEEKVDNLVEDGEGWVGLNHALAHPKITALEVDLEDVQRVVSNATKARFNFRQLPDTDAEEPASWQISRITKRDSISETIPVGTPITTFTEDLPNFIVYETSYQRYPLILAGGAITRAPTGMKFLSFQPLTVDQDGQDTRQPTANSEVAEVSIWINLKAALETQPMLSWQRTESGAIITSGEVPKSVWKKAVARRPDIGLLFEDGEVRKEVPANLRGRGAKGKAKGGNMNQAALRRAGSEDESASGNDEEE